MSISSFSICWKEAVLGHFFLSTEHIIKKQKVFFNPNSVKKMIIQEP
jgi:hypothetical protein